MQFLLISLLSIVSANNWKMHKHHYCLVNQSWRLKTLYNKSIMDCWKACDDTDGCVAVDIYDEKADWNREIHNECVLLKSGTFGNYPTFCPYDKKWMNCEHGVFEPVPSENKAIESVQEPEAVQEPNFPESVALENKTLEAVQEPEAQKSVEGTRTFIMGNYECATEQFCLINDDDVYQARKVTGMGYDIKTCLAACDDLEMCVGVDIQSYTKDWNKSQDWCMILVKGTFAKVPSCTISSQWMSCRSRNYPQHAASAQAVMV